MTLKLDLNENAWGPPPAVVRAVRTIGSEAIRTYPDAGPTAARVAGALGVPPAALRLTNGADEAIQAVFEAVLKPGDELILPVPTFSFYGEAARRRRARVFEVPYREGFRFPLAAACRALGRRPRLVVIVSPNNPTGTRLARADLLRLLDRAGRADVLLDETYAPFAGPCFARLVRSRPNLAVVGSFSKFQGMAGLRLGYVAAGPALLARIEQALPPYSVNAAALVAAEAALSADADLRRMKGKLIAERRRLAAGLRRLGLRVFSGAANFLLADAGAGCSGLCARLRASGV
ncbi:MAG: histidinol-phosphate aminotransferase family protein, partial [Candidatus Aminicenantes bacterium]|nr:histidinol-phosphate aminotransferase family protein [Candidatus Aminicenantes bacterium]